MSHQDRHEQGVEDVKLYNGSRPNSVEGGSSERMALAPRLETRMLSRARLAKNVRLQLMLGEKVTLDRPVKVRSHVSREW